MVTQPPANQLKVLGGVLFALVFCAAPFTLKSVRKREDQVAAMRDASYAKDDARSARLSTGGGAKS